MTEWLLVQYFQWVLNHMRDGAAYLFIVNASGSQKKYLYEQVSRFGLWTSMSHFEDWCTKYITKHQTLCLWLHARDPSDAVRMVKAMDTPPPKFKFTMKRKRTRGDMEAEHTQNKILETDHVFKKAREAADRAPLEEQQKDECVIS